jgi:regulator of sigma E protease
MNFLLGVAIFIFIGAVLGIPENVTKRVDRVIAGDPAAEAGLQAGDVLVGFDGKRELELAGIQKHIQEHPGEQIQLEIERDGEPLAIAITPKEVAIQVLEPREPVEGESEGEGRTQTSAEPDEEQSDEAPAPLKLEDTKVVTRKIGRIGVVFEVEVKKLGLWESIGAGFRQTYEMIKLLVQYLILAVTGRAPLMLQGPVGVAHILYENVQTSWMNFLNITALLTVGIGFLNLLPIPPLDGSRLVITGVEAIRRRPIDKHKENLVHLVGFGLLLTLVVVLTYKDILRIVTGG